MKTLALTYRKQRKTSRDVTMGAHYGARCPFCRQSLVIWPSEYEKRAVSTETGNVCVHFDGLLKNGKAAMRAKMSVVQSGTTVKVNGIPVPLSMNQLYAHIARMEEDLSAGGYWCMPGWCPRRRFEAIKSEVNRVYQANPDRWSAQHKERVEELERIELDRLLAKYGAPVDDSP